jgi:HD superfamily phosphohydrolase YqeK
MIQPSVDPEIAQVSESQTECRQIRDYLGEVRMPALRKNLLKLYDDLEEKLKTNPASTKYHHNYIGGLYTHTLEVMQFALDLFEQYKDKFVKHFTRDDVILIAFVHDLEKTTKYKKNTSYNAGITEPAFIYNYSKVDMNDTAEVVNLIGSYGLHLSDMQLNALGMHMGGWSVDRGKLTCLAALIHIADLLSTNLEIKQ